MVDGIDCCTSGDEIQQKKLFAWQNDYPGNPWDPGHDGPSVIQCDRG